MMAFFIYKHKSTVDVSTLGVVIKLFSNEKVDAYFTKFCAFSA